jgi:hypothetical protein
MVASEDIMSSHALIHVNLEQARKGGATSAWIPVLSYWYVIVNIMYYSSRFHHGKQSPHSRFYLAWITPSYTGNHGIFLIRIVSVLTRPHCTCGQRLSLMEPIRTYMNTARCVRYWILVWATSSVSDIRGSLDCNFVVGPTLN